MHTKTVDDLCLITFCNQEGEKYLASIYDSDELLQDPQVIDMIPID